jgi:hypothetical protein
VGDLLADAVEGLGAGLAWEEQLRAGLDDVVPDGERVGDHEGVAQVDAGGLDAVHGVGIELPGEGVHDERLQHLTEDDRLILESRCHGGYGCW